MVRTQTASISIWRDVVWASVAQAAKIHSIEHPVLNVKLPKESFATEFAAVLKELDGRSLTDFVDFFFEPDSVDKGTLVFKGEDERQDFFDWAVDEGCCPPLDKIKSGDDEDDHENGNKENEKTAARSAVDERELLEQELARVRARRAAELAEETRRREAKEQAHRKKDSEPEQVKLRRALIGRAKGLCTLQEKIDSASDKQKKAKLLAKLRKARAALFTAYEAYRRNFPVIAEVEQELARLA